jgi:hypothetical protein
LPYVDKEFLHLKLFDGINKHALVLIPALNNRTHTLQEKNTDDFNERYLVRNSSGSVHM